MNFKYTSCIFLLFQGILQGVWTLLPAPENVTIWSVNLRNELRWIPLKSDQTVKYTVQKRMNCSNDGSTGGVWKVVEDCASIEADRCNFNLNNRNYHCVTLRVRAQVGNLTSPWSQSEPFQPISQSCLGPPNVTLSHKSKLYLDIRDPFPRGDFSDTLKYRVTYWAENHILKKQIDSLSPVVIDNVDVGVKYCVKVHYLDGHNVINNSVPSLPQCVVITESEETQVIRILWIVLVVVAMVGVLMVACVYGVGKNYNKLKRALWPPLQPAGHFREFFMEEEHFIHLPESSESSEEAFDKISIVTTNNEAEEQEDVPPVPGET